MFRFFEKLIPPFPDNDTGPPPAGLIAFCRHYTRGMWTPLLLMSAASAGIAIMEASLFGFLGHLVDWLSTQNPDTFFRDEWLTIAGMSAVLLVLLPALTLFQSLLIHQTLLGNFPMAVRWRIHNYLLRQSMSFYQSEFSGRLATRMMQTALALREAVMKLLDVLVYVSVYFFSMVVLVGQADSRLTIPLLVWLTVYIGLQLWFIPRLKKVSARQADARAMMTGRIVDSYTNIATVKLFSHTARESQYAREGMNTFLGTAYSQMRLVTGFNVSTQMLNYLLTFTISGLAIWLWSHGQVSAGAIAIAVSLSLRLNGMAQWIMWEVGALFENIGTVTDGMESFSTTEEVRDADSAGSLTVTEGGIDFNHVSFGYGQNRAVIDDLSIHIKPGEKVGLVGRSGAGKSTLVNLLMRFYDLDSGSVTIDGQDIAAVTQESLRAHIGMVTQDTSLLHRSIRENILYGRTDAGEAELLEACRQAEAHDFISSLSDPDGNIGYDAQVGERGVKLSGGQRQRIAIARVLLKNAPVLILDEATSALDSEIEAAIQSSLYQLMQGKTVIAIAHRLSTIAAMDRLIVLDQGKVAEQGTHAELLQQNGIYAQLWAHQTGGYLGDNT